MSETGDSLTGGVRIWFSDSHKTRISSDMAKTEEESCPDEDKKSVKTHYNPNASQEKRREELLNNQRQRRDELLEKIRQLESDSTCSDSEVDEDEDFGQLNCEDKLQLQQVEEEGNEQEDYVNEEMDTSAGGDGKARRRRRRNRRPHRKRNAPCRVMLSEWLLEKPADFEEKWMGVFCPVGKRCLVVAAKGKTRVFSRTNEYMGVFQSLLPGGSRVNHNNPEFKKKVGVTILDCVWHEQEETFYVLDLLSWASHSTQNCDKAYRQFFQTSKFSDNPELMVKSTTHPYPFIPLPTFSCDRISAVMMDSLPVFNHQVDGVLFYHKDSFYFNEVNPLCLWLYLTDMEEKLQVSVAPDLLALQRSNPKPCPRRNVVSRKVTSDNDDNWRNKMEVR